MVEMNLQGKVKHQKENLGLENLTEQQPSEWLEVLGWGFCQIQYCFCSLVGQSCSPSGVCRDVANSSNRKHTPQGS